MSTERLTRHRPSIILPKHCPRKGELQDIFTNLYPSMEVDGSWLNPNCLLPSCRSHESKSEDTESTGNETGFEFPSLLPTTNCLERESGDTKSTDVTPGFELPWSSNPPFNFPVSLINAIRQPPMTNVNDHKTMNDSDRTLHSPSETVAIDHPCSFLSNDSCPFSDPEIYSHLFSNESTSYLSSNQIMNTGSFAKFLDEEEKEGELSKRVPLTPAISPFCHSIQNSSLLLTAARKIETPLYTHGDYGVSTLHSHLAWKPKKARMEGNPHDVSSPQDPLESKCNVSHCHINDNFDIVIGPKVEQEDNMTMPCDPSLGTDHGLASMQPSEDLISPVSGEPSSSSSCFSLRCSKLRRSKKADSTILKQLPIRSCRKRKIL